MSFRDNIRQVHPIIGTDRFSAGCDINTKQNFQGEWSLTDTIYSVYRPIGYRGIVRPVYVLVCRIEHLYAVESVALALAKIANVDIKDSDGVNGTFRSLQADEAQIFINEAFSILRKELDTNQIPLPLYEKLKQCLKNAPESGDSINKYWEIAIVLYLGIAIDGAPNFYEKIVGKDDRLDYLKRKDKQRGRDFFKAILAKELLKQIDAPSPSICLEISEKYLNAICPLLVPDIYKSPKIEIKEVCPVTKRGGRVTKMREKSAYEPNNRSSNRAPITALPTGFFANS